ncbi:MAG: hypothetical protein O4752_04355 [Trichodesmium sp. St4_bin8_1]|nr:hypothetical protein [Trichodesmium sp. St4_bin8_1]
MLLYKYKNKTKKRKIVTTGYLNSNILKQEAAISIEEEAIKAKKAALNLRKAVDRKVVRAIKNIREAIEKYPEYLEIIKNEFTNTKIDNQKEEEKIITVEEPKNKATERKKISNPEKENIFSYIFSLGDKVKIGSLNNKSNHEYYTIEKTPGAEDETYTIFSKGETEQDIISIKGKHLTIEKKAKPTDEKLLLTWIKNYALNAENNIELRKTGKLLSHETKRKMWDCMPIFQKNLLKCIKACTTKTDGQEAIKEGSILYYRDPENQEEKVAFYIGYYLSGKEIQEKDKRAIYIPETNEAIICEKRLLTQTREFLDPEKKEEGEYLEKIRLCMEKPEAYQSESNYIKNKNKESTIQVRAI